MKVWMLWGLPLMLAILGLTGCATQSAQSSPPGHPFRQLKKGQTYGDMVRALGEPDSSQAVRKDGEEVALSYIPVWGLVEAIGDMHPQSVEVYTYTGVGKVTVANNEIYRLKPE